MDTARLRRELVSSVRLLGTGERRLFGGGLVALVGYGLWVGATGAALKYGLDFAGQPITVRPWTGTTTVVFALVTLLWVLAPAIVGTYLLVGELTNVSGNLEQHYRMQYPVALLVPPAVLFAFGTVVGVALGEFPGPLLAVLTVLGLLVLVRTLAYSYRVFSFSVPLLVQAFVVVSLAVLAVALLAGVAVVAGRGVFLANAARGIGDLLGTSSIGELLTGTATPAGVTVPTLPGLAAGVPVVLATVYLLVQNGVGLATKFRGETVPRSSLRTGQRYPEFARPTVASASGDSAGTESTSKDTSATDDGDASSPSGVTGETADDPSTASTAETEEADETDDQESVSHTKVFTPPDDADSVEADIPNDVAETGADSSVEDDGADDRSSSPGDSETSVTADESGYRCPSCSDTFPSDTNFAFCPSCGSELEPE